MGTLGSPRIRRVTKLIDILNSFRIKRVVKLINTLNSFKIKGLLITLGGLSIFISSSLSDSNFILFSVNIKSSSLSPLTTSYIFKY